MHKYTDEQKQYIQSNHKGKLVKVLAKEFNSHFGTDLKQTQFRSYLKNHSMKNDIDTRFKPGNTSWNKDIKTKGWEPTQFKKGNRPHNWVPVGSEAITSDGYLKVKIAEPNIWKLKHTFVWEQYHGRPVPANHLIIFGDRNRDNFNIANLILITRRQLVTLNKMKLIQKDAGLTRSAVIVTDILHEINKLKKGKGERICKTT